MPLVLLMLVALVSSLSGQGTESDPMLKNTGGRPIVAHATTSPYRELAPEILRELVEIRSTQSGVGSTPASEAVARRLLAAGYPATGIHVAGPSPRKQNLVARLRGRTKDKPTLLFAHLDKVLADDLIYRHSNALVDTKASYIESSKSGKSNYISID
ncbi:MAG: hypothetical protein HXY18_13875, partial [Bryobacteraceae bacterium]|nr:hypothetical protein [Bryobacteraceae bacterium]